MSLLTYIVKDFWEGLSRKGQKGELFREWQRAVTRGKAGMVWASTMAHEGRYLPRSGLLERRG
jgi:hypothetical protein